MKDGGLCIQHSVKYTVTYFPLILALYPCSLSVDEFSLLSPAVQRSCFTFSGDKPPSSCLDGQWTVGQMHGEEEGILKSSHISKDIYIIIVAVVQPLICV